MIFFAKMKPLLTHVRTTPPLRSHYYLCRWNEKKVLVTSHRALSLTSHGAFSLIFLKKNEFQNLLFWSSKNCDDVTQGKYELNLILQIRMYQFL